MQDSKYQSDRSPSSIVTKDLLLMGTACLALLVSILIANPFVASAFNDDWSYAGVALDLARTGHFRYNGWGSPTIVFQSLWGAAFIRVFGFSFNVLRAATIPFSMGFVVLSYLLGIEAGLRRSLALFGALVVAVSPLFIPLAASFMTEPYSCFFSTLCLYAALKSVSSGTLDRGIIWLWVLTMAGILGGSNRQSVWTAPLCLLPYVWWTRRTERRFTIHAAVAYLGCLCALLLVIANFSQKYGPAELPTREWLHMLRSNGVNACYGALSMFLETSALSLPALLIAAPLWRRLTRLQIISIAAGCLLLLAFLWMFLGRTIGLVPFLGNILGPFGILQWEGNGLGKRPTVLHLRQRIPLTLLLLFSMAAWVIVARKSKWKETISPKTVTACLIFTVSYLPLLIPGMLLYFVYDRYILPVLPLFVIAILLPLQALGVSIPKISWMCLAAFALFGIAITHDYAAELEARAKTASLAEQHGIPENHISTGFERDGWFQVSNGRSIQPTLYGQKIKIDYNYFWFWFHTKAIQPDYVGIVANPSDHLPGVILEVPFTAWSPPHRRIVALVNRENIPKE